MSSELSPFLEMARQMWMQAGPQPLSEDQLTLARRLLGLPPSLRAASENSPLSGPEAASVPSMSDSMRFVLAGLMNLYQEENAPRAKETHRGIMPTAHGWYTSIRRSVDLLNTPEGRTYADCLAPVRRTAMEHVAALRWLAQNGERAMGAIDRINNEQTKRLREAVRKADWKAGDTQAGGRTQAELLGHKELDVFLSNSFERMKECGGKDMAVAHLSDTFYCHPCWRSASPYVSENGDRALLLSTNNDVQPDAATVGTLLMLGASGAFNDCQDGEPWSVQLDEFEERVRSLLDAN